MPAVNMVAKLLAQLPGRQIGDLLELICDVTCEIHILRRAIPARGGALPVAEGQHVFKDDPVVFHLDDGSMFSTADDLLVEQIYNAVCAEIEDRIKSLELAVDGLRRRGHEDNA